MDAYQKIIQLLDDRKISYKVHSHDDIPTVTIAKEKINFNIDSCIKTIAFKYDERYIFIAIRAEDKIDYPKLCSQLDIFRNKLSKAIDTDLEIMFGYQSGGIAPISLDESIIVVFDTNISADGNVFCGSGLRNKTLEINFDDLVSLNNVFVLDVSKD